MNKMCAAMQSIVIIALLTLVGWADSETCPAKYKRFSTEHSFCIAPNPSCQIQRKGVTQKDKDLILKLHNDFRSKVAMGNENRAKGGKLPQAADMMQMEWDNELATIAQKWTENCNFEHDCKECREVENFKVGQNIYTEHGKLPLAADWTKAITAFYDEVKDYHTSWLGSYETHPGPKTGHLTELIWSRSWRIGCGYSIYKDGGSLRRFYACNYGPGGNSKGQPVYTPGKPCSACPSNTECSTIGTFSSPGLCKMKNPNTAPIFPINTNDFLFYCGDLFTCHADWKGDGTWKTVPSVGGNYATIVLKGGESNTVSFSKPIKPHGDKFCIHFKFRKSSLDASKEDKSILQANYKMGRSSSGPTNINAGVTSFKDNYIDIKWGKETILSFTFSVPKRAGEHVLDLRKIDAFDGSCNSRKH